jgi:penicillin amidase
VDSTDPAARWSGWLAPDEIPRVADPADGVLWTANNRVAAGDDLARIGLGPYAHGARAQQIRDALRAHEGTFDVSDLLAVQLDDRALFLARWQALLLETLDTEAVDGRPDRAALRERVAAWGGRASVESPGYGVVKRFRDTLAGRLMTALLAPARDRYELADDLGESALWALVTEQPAHFLPAGAASWRDVLLSATDAAADAPATWGDANRAALAHPMADALPVVGRFLRMPADPLAGDGRMPRVARSTFGASQRMVVSPGHEDDGVMQMPGGQAGHPLSPYWGAGHDAWVTGRPTPFRPGRARWTLTLVPG